MEVIRLDTGNSMTWRSEIPFSNSRLIVADFPAAEAHLSSLLWQLMGRKKITPNLKMVIQQLEGIGEGLSAVEFRALADLAEHCGAVKVSVVQHDRELSSQEAFLLARSLKVKYSYWPLVFLLMLLILYLLGSFGVRA